MKKILLIFSMVSIFLVYIIVQAGARIESLLSTEDIGLIVDNKKQSSSSPNKYEVIGSIKGYNKDGVSFTTQVYKSPVDGERIFFTKEYYNSIVEMNSVLKNIENSYSEIIEKNSLIYSNGNLEGERLLGKRPLQDEKSEGFCLVRSVDKILYFIKSDSLHHIREFEKYIFNSKTVF